ncbi:uncharacterized protein LOC105941488 [Maylandia zebra]|uniref:uncharacterized protein LOC105941488 n=1 Tax=Maylandia zebra TaxID=106582 RepID=UPI00403CF0D8
MRNLLSTMKSAVGLLIFLLSHDASTAPINIASASTENATPQTGIYLDIGIIAGIVMVTVIVFALIGMSDHKQDDERVKLNKGTTSSQETRCTKCCTKYSEYCCSLLSCCCSGCAESLTKACDICCMSLGYGCMVPL